MTIVKKGKAFRSVSGESNQTPGTNQSSRLQPLPAWSRNQQPAVGMTMPEEQHPGMRWEANNGRKGRWETIMRLWEGCSIKKVSIRDKAVSGQASGVKPATTLRLPGSPSPEAISSAVSTALFFSLCQIAEGAALDRIRHCTSSLTWERP